MINRMSFGAFDVPELKDAMVNIKESGPSRPVIVPDDGRFQSVSETMIERIKKSRLN